jgi:hypothetical protein
MGEKDLNLLYMAILLAKVINNFKFLAPAKLELNLK